MTSHAPYFQKRCLAIANMALTAMVLLLIIVTVAVLDGVFSGDAENQSPYSNLAPLAWLIPIYPAIAALNRLRNMLYRFSEGELFSAKNSGDIQFIAFNAIITILLKVFVVAGLYALVRYGWHGTWWIELEPGDSASILLASVLWLFAWLIAEGEKLQTENKGFI